MSKRVASLSGAALRVEALREEGRAELVDLLESLPGSKCLVLESHIGGLLNHVIPEGSKLLRERGVTYFRELRGELGAFEDRNGVAAEPDHIVYLVRASIPNMKMIAAQINSRTKAGAGDFRYKVYFVPHRTLICEQVLQEERVLRKVDVGDYPLDLVPLEKDVLSLELDGLFRRVHLDGDTSGLSVVARSVQKLQAVFGPIPNVKAKGPAAVACLHRSMRMRREEAGADAAGEGDSGGGGGISTIPGIDTLILLDRKVDLVTALATPLTYEGLIDDLIGIENGSVRLDADLVEAGDGNEATAGSAAGGAAATGAAAAAAALGPDGNKKQVPVPLNSDDPLFCTVRDVHVEQLMPFLQDKAKHIRESYNQFRANRDQSITEIHEFVKKIPGLKEDYKSLNLHINIAEVIMEGSGGPEFRKRWQTERAMLEGEDCCEVIEEMISMQEPALKVIRLMCLQSATDAGIKTSKYEFLKREIVQTYGYEHLYTLNNLESVGLLKKREKGWVGTADAASPWPSLRRALRLVNDAVDVRSPDDIAYVSSGYAPLSVRLVQASVRPGWTTAGEALKLLPGACVEVTQDPDGPPEDLPTALRRQIEQRGKLAASSSVDGPFGVGGGSSSTGDGGGDDSPKKKVLVVYFIGGVTYMEIAALRFLNKQREFPFEIVTATTKIANGDEFVGTLLPKFDNCLQR
ncbi:unnamed protein product [Pylaiella littoralis]